MSKIPSTLIIVPERRPEWCRKINCPNWPGYDRCYLKDYVYRALGSGLGRVAKKEMGRIESTASADPEKVIDYCKKSLEQF